MNEKQKSKRKFRQSKKWKEYKKKMREDCGKKDAITHKPLRGLWQLHHRNLDERQYEELRDDWFLPCNNLTHKVIHWMYTYYKTDPQIIDRLQAEMIKMAEINNEEWKLNDSYCGV